VNRRSFFKNFFSTVAAVAVAQRLVIDLALTARNSVTPVYWVLWTRTSEVERLPPMLVFSKLFNSVEWKTDGVCEQI
jgi:hypothetical protein